MKKILIWPTEASCRDYAQSFRWSHSGSNLCLDFHGNPIAARLVVFSDGNHHMALEACCQAFLKLYPEVNDIFYATTPPGVLVQALQNNGLLLGNLHFDIKPHVFISPKNILDNLQKENFVSSHHAFAKSKGNVLLVRKNNPKKILNISDLFRDDVRLIISNPETEKASYEVYRETLINFAQTENIDIESIENLLRNDKSTNYSQAIHHREVPQAIYSGQADVALVYYHLALRYTRIFPDDFSYILLDGLESDEGAASTNVTTDYHIGVVGDGGDWGNKFYEFMTSDSALGEYEKHGLVAPKAKRI